MVLKIRRIIMSMVTLHDSISLITTITQSQAGVVQLPFILDPGIQITRQGRVEESRLQYYLTVLRLCGTFGETLLLKGIQCQLDYSDSLFSTTHIIWLSWTIKHLSNDIYFTISHTTYWTLPLRCRYTFAAYNDNMFIKEVRCKEVRCRVTFFNPYNSPVHAVDRCNATCGPVRSDAQAREHKTSIAMNHLPMKTPPRSVQHVARMPVYKWVVNRSVLLYSSKYAYPRLTKDSIHHLYRRMCAMQVII